MTLPAFARFAVRQRQCDLDPHLEHAATRAVLDWFGATVAGAVTEPTRRLTQAVLPEESSGTCGLVAQGHRVSTRTAALINATASHVVEMDDIYREGIYHPGSPTVGAALAVAQRQEVGGRDLLRAVAVGYEVGDRIAAAIQPSHYRFWHTTGTVGTIGAAAAAADLLQLDEKATADALATATTQAAGLQQAFRSEAMSKPLHAGHAAETGVLAALAGAQGFTGAHDVLDGPSGFGAAMSDDPSWQEATADLGLAEWGICRPTVKNHACCGHTFAAIDAILALRGQGLTHEQVRSIRVATYGTAVKVAGNPDPKTAFEAKFSTAFCVSAALVLGSVRMDAFSDQHLWNPKIRGLVGLVDLEIDEDFDARFPSQRAARVSVTTHDGEVHEYLRHTRKGDPDDPLTDKEMSSKFLELATPVLGDDGAESLKQQLWSLNKFQNVNELDLGTPRAVRI